MADRRSSFALALAFSLVLLLVVISSSVRLKRSKLTLAAHLGAHRADISSPPSQVPDPPNPHTSLQSLGVGPRGGLPRRRTLLLTLGKNLDLKVNESMTVAQLKKLCHAGMAEIRASAATHSERLRRLGVGPRGGLPTNVTKPQLLTLAKNLNLKVKESMAFSQLKELCRAGVAELQATTSTWNERPGPHVGPLPASPVPHPSSPSIVLQRLGGGPRGGVHRKTQLLTLAQNLAFPLGVLSTCYITLTPRLTMKGFLQVQPNCFKQRTHIFETEGELAKRTTRPHAVETMRWVGSDGTATDSRGTKHVSSGETEDTNALHADSSQKNTWLESLVRETEAARNTHFLKAEAVVGASETTPEEEKPTQIVEVPPAHAKAVSTLDAQREEEERGEDAEGEEENALLVVCILLHAAPPSPEALMTEELPLSRDEAVKAFLSRALKVFDEFEEESYVPYKEPTPASPRRGAGFNASQRPMMDDAEAVPAPAPEAPNGEIKMPRQHPQTKQRKRRRRRKPAQNDVDTQEEKLGEGVEGTPTAAAKPFDSQSLQASLEELQIASDTLLKAESDVDDDEHGIIKRSELNRISRKKYFFDGPRVLCF